LTSLRAREKTKIIASTQYQSVDFMGKNKLLMNLRSQRHATMRL